MQNQQNQDVSKNDKSVKGFVGMGTENTSKEGGRTSEEVKKARLANASSDGGTHLGGDLEEQDSGGKEGNNGAHPF